jgi:hypothetical protein
VTHFVIGCLRKVNVPEADCGEWVRHQRADHFVGNRAKRLARVPSSNRHGHDHTGRPEPANRQHCGSHRRSGGQAIVDQNDGAPFEW